MNSPSVPALAALALAGGVLLAVGAATTVLVGRICGREPRGIDAALGIACAGYLTFWVCFAIPQLGQAFASVLMVLCATLCAWQWRTTLAWLRPRRGILAVMALAATLYCALLLLHPAANWSLTARERFLGNLPADNELPRGLAEMTGSGNRSRVIGGDWLTSDRPPLQAGVILLVRPVFALAGISDELGANAVGLWLQLLWLPALHLLLRWLGLGTAVAVGVGAALAGTGFLLINSVYVWPKLAAAAFATSAFVLWIRAGSRPPTEARPDFLRGGACAGAAWLLHGGVAFAFLALAPWIVWRWRAWRQWFAAAAVFAGLALPWTAYQRGYAPPGDRLLKWHLGGSVAPDTKSLGETLRDNYRRVGWTGAWQARVANARMIFGGDWSKLFVPRGRVDGFARRGDEFYYPLRALGAWVFGLAALPLLLWRWRRTNATDAAVPRAHATAAAWAVGTLAVWVALMFSPHEVFTHQGSYTVQLVLLGLLAAWAVLLHRGVFLALAGYQLLLFGLSWVRPNGAATLGHDPVAPWIAAVAAAGLVVVTLRGLTRAASAGARRDDPNGGFRTLDCLPSNDLLDPSRSAAVAPPPARMTSVRPTNALAGWRGAAWWIAALAITLSGFLLRAAYYRAGGHPDEPIAVAVVGHMRHSGEWDTNWAKADLPPGLKYHQYNFSSYHYALFFAYRLAKTVPALDAWRSEDGGYWLYRFFSVVMAGIVVWQSIHLGRRAHGLATGLLAGLLVALAPLLVQDARFIRAEAFTTVLTLVAVALCWPAGTIAAWRPLAGAFTIGLLIAAKVSFVALAWLPAVPLVALRWSRSRRAVLLAVIPIAILAGFAVGAPGAIADPPAFLHGVRHLAEQYAGAHPPHSHLPVRPVGDLLLRYFGAMLGWSTLLAMLAGTAALLYQRRWSAALLLAGPVALFAGYFATRTIFFERNLSHVVPLVAILAAIGAVEFARLVGRGRRGVTVAAGLALASLLLTRPARVTKVLVGDELSGRTTDAIVEFEKTLAAAQAKTTWLSTELLVESQLDQLRTHLDQEAGPLLVRVLDFNDEWTAAQLPRLNEKYSARKLGEWPTPFANFPVCTLLTYHRPHAHYYAVSRRP